MKIQLANWKIDKLNLIKKEEVDDDSLEKNFGLRIQQIYPDDSTKTFIIVFYIQLVNGTFALEIKANFSFNTDTLIDDEFIESTFPKINAPAIAFPFLRAYISNLTLQSGYPTIILPSINFIELYKQRKEDENSEVE